MASRKEALNLEVLEMISIMERKGAVDDRLGKIRDMNETSNPFPLLELIPTFNKDAYSILREMSVALGKTDLDYVHLEELCSKMEGKTSSIGACRMARACSRLCQAADEKSKDGCLNAFEILKNDYLSLNWMLEWTAELERRILSLETNDP
ncbi:hypothetical protein SLA2020_470660 [Shorea laevis]